MMQTKTPVGAGAFSRAVESTRHTHRSTTGAPLSTTGTPVYLNGKIVGRKVGDVFERPIETSRHIFRLWHAISTHTEVIAQLDGVNWLRCQDENGRDYFATMAELQEHGRPLNHPVYGPQIALALSFWTDRPERQSRML